MKKRMSFLSKKKWKIVIWWRRRLQWREKNILSMCCRAFAPLSAIILPYVYFYATLLSLQTCARQIKKFTLFISTRSPSHSRTLFFVMLHKHFVMKPFFVIFVCCCCSIISTIAKKMWARERERHPQTCNSSKITKVAK
jgi:hypothetical protein